MGDVGRNAELCVKRKGIPKKFRLSKRSRLPRLPPNIDQPRYHMPRHCTVRHTPTSQNQHRLLALLPALVLGAAGLAGAAELSTADAEHRAQATYREYFDLLSLPNDAIAPEDIRKNADWLERAFRNRGFTTKQLANAGKPML